jgi:hypothetical protein
MATRPHILPGMNPIKTLFKKSTKTTPAEKKLLQRANKKNTKNPHIACLLFITTYTVMSSTTSSSARHFLCAASTNAPTAVSQLGACIATILATSSLDKNSLTRSRDGREMVAKGRGETQWKRKHRENDMLKTDILVQHAPFFESNINKMKFRSDNLTRMKFGDSKKKAVPDAIRGPEAKHIIGSNVVFNNFRYINHPHFV